MNQLQENLQELLNSMSEEDTAILTENRFPYIFTKAFYFLQDNPNLYSQNDAFGLPDETFSSQDLKNITIGCEQILEGKGLRTDFPFEGIGVRGCHKLFELFHFKFVNQRAHSSNKGGFKDEMTFEHVIDKSTIKCHNLV
ncbi:hypothetical protein N9Q89_03715 [Flavobacteriaceae bacterium]|jgi:hypothetical protein|nr:hypothetical protein [Flavobacteriaceae bacterium]